MSRKKPATLGPSKAFETWAAKDAKLREQWHDAYDREDYKECNRLAAAMKRIMRDYKRKRDSG